MNNIATPPHRLKINAHNYELHATINTSQNTFNGRPLINITVHPPGKENTLYQLNEPITTHSEKDGGVSIGINTPEFAPIGRMDSAIRKHFMNALVREIDKVKFNEGETKMQGIVSLDFSSSDRERGHVSICYDGSYNRGVSREKEIAFLKHIADKLPELATNAARSAESTMNRIGGAKNWDGTRAESDHGPGFSFN